MLYIIVGNEDSSTLLYWGLYGTQEMETHESEKRFTVQNNMALVLKLNKVDSKHIFITLLLLCLRAINHLSIDMLII
jgi:hypothetical protein